MNRYTYDSGTYLTKIERALNQDGTAGAVSTFTVDSSSGLTTSSTADVKNDIATQTEYDAFGRPVKISEARGTTLERQTALQYSLQQRRVIIQKDKTSTGDGLLISAQHFDSRGRIWRTRTIEDGTQASATGNLTSGVLVDSQQALSSAGRCTVMSNPYRVNDAANSPGTLGWTLTNCDALGRPTTVWHFAGAAVPTCGEMNTIASTVKSKREYDSSYAFPNSTRFGILTQQTDEAGKKQQTVVDGFGRAVLVKEDPAGSLNYATTYAYDVLDNLIGVTQGTQARTYSYDSLGRLTYSLQPEMDPTGTIAKLAAAYTYTNDGLVATRSDGIGTLTTYSYDPLNRIAVVVHSGGNGIRSATITRCYNGQVSTSDLTCGWPATTILQAHGRLTESRSNLASESLVSLTTYNQFDVLGRVLASQQKTNGTGYGFQYGFDLAGAVTSQTNLFTNRTIATVYNNLEQPVAVTGSIFSGAVTKYAQNGNYAAHGGLTSVGMSVIGTTPTWTETWNYNSRLQATGVFGGGGLSLSYNYGGAANNGNVVFQTVARGAVTQTQNYAYDGVNRLCAAAEATGTGTLAVSCGGAAPSGANWSQNSNYDQFGNRWVSNPAGYSLGTFTPVASSHFDGGNHLNMSGVVHDAAGNQTQLGAGLLMAYDADGRMESSTLSGLPTVYGYDADGRRVLKRTGAATAAPTVYVYDALGAASHGDRWGECGGVHDVLLDGRPAREYARDGGGV